MKVFESNCTFNYSWEDVSLANWRKYCAWNTKSTHVIAVDTLSRSVDPETGILITERLITCKQAAPRWLKAIFGTEESYVREISYVDPVAKTVTMKSMNLTLNNLLNVQETVQYVPDPECPAKRTLFKQDAKITAYGAFTRLRNAIEDFSVDRFHQNAIKGREGFEAVLQMSQKAFKELREGTIQEATMQTA
ncbi:MSF1-domain-containing protein [Terfezia boudieri ATCC MYA-4762]|uniref:MSF1-domain-containing protein n=1 Tax=Terfezia boudieri ATCC MYA-4762 TaxID=1051890 RepID=A0A3N4M035_9PEZI|nr:MSF1-domain-containing protein [Terfezia boudieri ATCC MYA-4762]